MESIHSNSTVKSLIETKNKVLWSIHKDLKFTFTEEQGKPISPPLKEVIDQIMTNKIPCVFVSPHLDDAVLSAGGMIKFLSDKTRVVVANVFTRPFTQTDIKWANICGYDDAEVFMGNRIREDAFALRQLGIEEVNNLGFSAEWRLKGATPETRAAQTESIRSKVKTIVSGLGQDAVVFYPIAEGRQHEDHKVTRDAANYFPKHIYWKEFRLYKDRYPKNPEEGFAVTNGLVHGRFSQNLVEKSLALTNYRSQTRALFPNPNVKIPSEKYFFSPDLFK